MLITKLQYSYKFFVNHNPDRIATSIKMALFESMAHVSIVRLLTPPTLTFFGSPG